MSLVCIEDYQAFVDVASRKMLLSRAALCRKVLWWWWLQGGPELRAGSMLGSNGGTERRIHRRGTESAENGK